MKNVLSALATIILSILFLASSCSKSPSGPTATSQSVSAANITVETGQVGTLAKAATINLSTLDLSLSAPGQDTIRKSFNLSGNGEKTINVIIPNLACNKTWRLTAVSKDDAGVVIHYGYTSFLVNPAETSIVSLNLTAVYSMLAVNVFPIRDSIVKCVLLVDNDTASKSEFAKQSRLGDTVRLGFDYLTADNTHAIGVVLFGDIAGKLFEFYKGEISVTPIAGENASYTLNLLWVGPSNLCSSCPASISISLGNIGTTYINANVPCTPHCDAGAGFIMPYSGKLYISGAGGDAGAGSQVSVGTDISSFTALLSGLPDFTDEAYAGSFLQGEVVQFTMKTDWAGIYWAATNDTAGASAKVAFYDSDNSLGLNGKTLEKVTDSSWLFHWDDAASYTCDDDDNDVLIKLRVSKDP